MTCLQDGTDRLSGASRTARHGNLWLPFREYISHRKSPPNLGSDTARYLQPTLLMNAPRVCPICGLESIAPHQFRGLHLFKATHGCVICVHRSSSALSQVWIFRKGAAASSV